MKEFFPHITIDPNTQFGKPIITGTRVPVEIIIGHIAAGETIQAVAAEYGISEQDVQAALKYASKIIGEETLIYNSAFSH
jgi:uncharacterized protein (DUF433 family)